MTNERDRAAAIYLENAMPEIVGGLAPTDLRESICGASGARRRAARRRCDEAERAVVSMQRQRTAMLTAAIVLLGAGTVIGTLLMGASDVVEVRQDRVETRVVRPYTVEEFQDLLGEVESISLCVKTTGLMTGVPVPRTPAGSEHITDREWIGSVVAGLRGCDTPLGNRWAWSNEVLLHLPRDRVVVCSAIGEGAADAPRLAVQGWPRDCSMPEDLAKVLRQRLAPLTQRAMRAAGVVMSEQELEALAKRPEAGSTTELHLFELSGGLPALAAFADLRTLTVTRSAPSVTGDDLKRLRGLTQLEQVALPDTSLGDDSLASLAVLPRLRSLDLSGCGTLAAEPRRERLTGVGFAVFAEHAALQDLRLSRCRDLDSAGLRRIAAIPNLRSLQLREVGTTFAADDLELGLLDGARNLVELDLSAAALRVDEALPALAGLPRLRVLRLDRTDVTGKGLAALRTCRTLRVLSLSGAGGADAIEPLAHMLWLEELRLAGCPAVDDAALVALLPLTNLRRLALSGCYQLTAQSIDVLCKMGYLQWLDLRGCVGLGADVEQRRTLQRGLPECDILW